MTEPTLFQPVDGDGDDAAGPRGSSTNTRAPLAARMRPTTLDDYVGHAEVVGPGTPVRTMLDDGRLTSLILWGPPGCGKTTLARVVANHVDAAWTELSAVTAGVKDVRATIEAAQQRRRMFDRGTVLFLDEIHRFNKAQQDALLPAVESGDLTLVGATTENPYFELNAPLLSRCRLVRLEPLTADDLAAIVRAAVTSDAGYDGRVTLTDDAVGALAAIGDGDARTALNALEVAVELAGTGTVDEPVEVTVDLLADTHAGLRYDRGDAHYDQVSAFIKSMRGSDPDAAAYWLQRMLAAGEDPRFLARRMVVLASEDIGLADPTALPLAVAAFDALDKVGLPEANFALTHCAIALALAPKSNAVTRAMGQAKRAVTETGNLPVPMHLRDAHSKAGKVLGHGEGYRYPHDHDGGWVEQQYLPDRLADARGRIWKPTERDRPPDGSGNDA